VQLARRVSAISTEVNLKHTTEEKRAKRITMEDQEERLKVRHLLPKEKEGRWEPRGFGIKRKRHGIRRRLLGEQHWGELGNKREKNRKGEIGKFAVKSKERETVGRQKTAGVDRPHGHGHGGATIACKESSDAQGGWGGED